MKKNVVIFQQTGIVRRIDELGRIVIPKVLRQEAEIKEGDAFEIFLDKDNKAVYLKKYDPFN